MSTISYNSDLDHVSDLRRHASESDISNFGSISEGEWESFNQELESKLTKLKTESKVNGNLLTKTNKRVLNTINESQLPNPLLDDLILTNEQYDLDRIPMPDLTDEEQNLPEDQLKRRVILKKGYLMRNDNLLDINALMNLLEPAQMSQGKQSDGIVTYATGPKDFYFIWKEDLDKRQLMGQWCTYSVLNDGVERLKEWNTECILGLAFLVQFGMWMRANISKAKAETDSQTSYYIAFFIDVGLKKEVSLNMIRKLPEKFKQIPPYALHCQLYEADVNSRYVEDKFLRDQFLFEVDNENQFIQCQLVKFPSNETEDDRFHVKLWKVHSDASVYDFNADILRSNIERQDIECIKFNIFSKILMESLWTNSLKGNKVPTCKSFPYKGIHRVMITNANSPSDFSIQILIEAWVDVKHPQFIVDMQAYYEDPATARKYHLRSYLPVIGRDYVVNIGKPYGYQRCRVLTRNSEDECCVVCLDLGMEMEVRNSEFLELDRYFASVFARGFKGYLEHIRSISGSNEWSQRSNEAFRRFAIGKEFDGIVVGQMENGSKIDVQSAFDQFKSKLGFILVPTSPLANKSTFNSYFCLSGFALSTDVGSAYEMDSTGLNDTIVLNFDLIKKELKCIQGNDFSDPEKFREQLESLKKAETKQVNKNKENAYLGITENVPDCIREVLCTSNITIINSPSCFYIQNRRNLPYLTNMMSYIKSLVENEPELIEGSISAGSPVAVHVFKDVEEPIWFRGVIRSCVSSVSLAMVILIDVGNEISAEYSALRHLPESFCKIPGFAFRVHFDVKGLLPDSENGVWSSKAQLVLRRYVALWHRTKPIYYVWRTNQQPPISLDYFGQELYFSKDANNWVPKVPQNLISVQSYMNLLNCSSTTQILLKNFHRSIGISISYEAVTKNPNMPYCFTPVWDCLLETKAAIYNPNN